MHNSSENPTNGSLKIKKLKIVLVLLSSYLVVQIIAGFYSGSLALLADAGHMFTDVFGIGLALLATIYSKKEATPNHTFGFFRTEILASLLNSLILLFLSIIIVYEALRRFSDPSEIHSMSVIIVATFGLIINIIGIYFIKDQGVHSHNHDDIHQNDNSNNKIEDLNIQSAKIELLGDSLGSISVIVGGIVITITNLNIIDPLLSIGLACFMIPRVWTILKKAINILMEGVPSNLSYEEIKRALFQIKGVTGIFDLHIWSITSGINALSAHIVVMDTSDSYKILHDINAELEKKFNITHSTIQIERYHPVKEVHKKEY